MSFSSMSTLIFFVTFFAIVRQTRLSKVIRSPIPADFQFTATQYNLSMFENSIAGTVATVDYSFQGADRNGKPRQFWNSQKFVAVEKMGVYLPKGYHQVQFKIVEGDKQQRFTASAKKLGNFAFLIIEHKHDDDILNRELQGEFSLLIRATAKKKRANALEASAVVNLRILDENDNAPMFRKLDYLAEVDDRVPLNSRIIQLDGFDADEGLNGELYYSMITPSEQFYLEPNSGWIRTFLPLKPGNYSFECLIEDRASRLFYYRQEQDGISPPTFLRNTAKVIINVIAARSKNVAKPKIHQKILPFEPFQPQMQSAALLTIEDPVTEPSQISLELASISSIANFYTPLLSLQRRSSTEYLVQISHYAHDGPIYFTIEMWDEHSMQTPLATNGQQRTLIMSQNITINPDFTQRRVWFVDLMKNADMINKETIVVNESIPEGYVVKQFMAEATYAEDGHRIRYKLIPLDENASKSGAIFPFDLNHHTGQLRLKSSLDFDNPKQQKTFQCTIVANLLLNDKHHPVKSSLTKEIVIKAERKVILKLADANDNCPKFSQQSIPKNFIINLKSREPKTPTDAVIFKPQVTDADVGDHGKIVYKMIGLDGSDEYFDIDPRNGQIHISVSSLPNTSDSWILKILAMDLGWPLSHYTQLTLAVRAPGSNAISATNLGLRDTCQMENLHEPVFETSKKQLHVTEDASVGKEIGPVIATDRDSGYNGLLQYSLSSTTYFGIDLYMGSIFVQRPLTELIRQKADKSSEFFDYSIEVAAKDMALNNSKSSKITLIIRVHGSNMHAPVFEKPAYIIDVTENNAAGMELARLKATDKDIGNKNGKVEYRFAVDTADMFSLDPDTGVLRLEKSLDRERDSLREISSKENRVLRAVDRGITVLAMAVDRGSPAKIGFVNITIRVIDSNDNAPRCLKSVHKASLLEDSPNGQLVACLSVEDPDMGLNAFLNYSIETKDGNVPFRIDSSTGCVFVHTMKPLDYEKTPFYNFSIRVSDHGSPPLHSECAIEINLLDVNENVLPPQFSEIALEGSVEENKPSKTEVLRVHASDPEGTTVSYRFVGGSGLGFFEINPETGVIRTTMELDYETSAFYWLTVRAQDSSSWPLISHLHILVRVLNQNDRAPVFTQPIYFVSVAENSAENKVILKIEATDPDMNIKNVERTGGSGVKYAIAKGNPQSNFAIDESTGYIVTGKRRLDRETQAEHEIHIRACDYGTPQLCTTAVVVVAVEDLNDNSPVFPAALNSNAINVAADRIGKLCQVFAHDADAPGPNSRVRYELVGQKDDRFFIDEFGRISTSERLKAGQEYQLVVLAIDGGNPSLQSNASFILKALGRVSKLTASNRKPLLVDREIWRELYVSDSDSVGITVGIVKAVDEDGDPLWWNVLDDDPITNHSFTFRGNSGELVLAKPVSLIDPSLSQIIVPFSLSDGVDEVKDQINIRISRSTASRPKFVQLVSTVELAADTPVGFVPFTARAIFDETMTGVSHPHKIVYSIHSVDDLLAADLLKIDPSNGNLIIEKVPSKRPCTNFSVVISAKAGGKENFAFVLFRPKFSNEHAPAFIFDQYDFMLQSVINVIGKVEAYDPDPHEFGRVVYSIVSGNELGYFSLNSTTGEIHLTANKSVPQTFNGIILTVRAMDLAPTPRSVTCTVRILPINWTSLKDKEVQFTKDFIRLSLDDSVAIHSFLDSMVPFAAPYSSQTGLLYFDLQDTCPLIEIHPFTGTVRLRQSLPLILTLDDVMALNCSVIVRSAVSKENTTLQLFIKIISSSLSDIHFQPTQINGTILENSSPGTLVFTSHFSNISSNSQKALQISAVSSTGVPPNTHLQYRILSPREPFFAIDSYSGTIRNFIPVDFEAVKQWSFHIMAQDTSAFPELKYTSTPALVTISVRDANDIVPEFKEEGYKFRLHLPPIKGLYLGSVRADDSDSVDEVRYALREIKPSSMLRLFYVDRHSGAVYVYSNETSHFGSPTYELKIIASDGIHTTQTTAQVNVIAANSTELSSINNLRFSKETFTLTVPENMSTTEENAVKMKNLLSLWPVNAHFGERFKFRLLNSHPSFVMDEQSGMLSLNISNSLDREIAPRVQLVVQAESINGNVPRPATTLINVEVEDINDCAPQFLQQSYTATISEEASVGDRLVNVKAKDQDLGMSGVVRYTLAEDAPAFLDINKYDGRISIISAPPQSQLHLGKYFEFHVVATDKGNPPLNSLVVVHVQVTNKHQPTFSHTHYTARVSESATPGTQVSSVRAYSNTDGVIGYRIAGGDPHKHFVIDFSKGTVTVNKPLDRELIPQYQLTVEATDVTRILNGQSVKASATVDIYLDDVNDSPPQFEEPIYEFFISESATTGTLLGIIRATDPDLTHIQASSPTFQLLDEDERNNNENLNSGNLHYSIVEGNKSVVSLDSNTGQVYLASRVDFEQRHFYEYTIQVRDMNRLTGEAVLQLHIEDANDEPPHFVTTEDQPLILTLRAGTRPQFMYKFEAEDRDTVASLPITGQKFDFAISEGDETIFQMDTRNGVLSTLRALDAQELNQLNNGEETTKHLNVSVYDGIFKAFMGVTVQVIVNNIDPLHFEQSVYPVILNENRASANKSSIASVKIRGGSSPVKYSIAGATTSTVWPVAVDQTSGRVFLIERLDREKFSTGIGQSASFSVPIMAVDTAGCEAFTRLEVTVQDENDNEPIWVAPSDGYAMSLDLGNAQEGESLAMVLAIDTDIDDRLEYSLLTEGGHTNALDPTKIFDIHPTQGYVTLKKRSTQIDSKLQKDPEQQLTFSIRVSDSGNPPHQNTIPFTMQLISSGNPLNVPPQFSQLHYLYAISEDAPGGKVLGQLQGNDLTQNSRKTTFSIISNNKDQLPFTIDQTTGQLAVTGALDYEQTSRYDFIAQISSTDEDSTELHTFAVVTVSVVDVNDNAPIFKTIYDRLKIYEDVSPGTIIAVFLATDADKESTHSRIVYTMEQISKTGSIEEKAHFTLDGESGWLMVRSEGLDSERRRQYTLRITASDEGGLRNSQDVTVNVMDLNDSPPVFDLDEYIIKLNANDIKPNEPILRFNVTDADVNPTPAQIIRLFIVSGDEDQIFAISKEHQLSFKTLPLRSRTSEEQNNALQMLLSVVAFDGIHSTSTNVKIYLNFGNTTVKKNFCDDKELSLIIPANLPPKHAIHSFSNLSDTSLILNHVMESNKVPFDIVNNSMLILNEGYHKEPNYTLRVRRRPEQRDGQWLASCIQVFHIKVQNANRYTPSFERKLITATIKENMNISSDQSYFVLKLDAKDEDTGEFGNLSYAFAGSSNKIHEFFSLDETTGVISLKKSLDREAQDQLDISIRVVDGGGLTDTVKILMRVEDVNDNAPTFKQTIYRLKVLENEQVGYELLKVHADDADLNSEIIYEMGSNVPSKITKFIHLATDGTLKLASELDYELTQQLVFTVVAKDNGQPPLSSSCTVDIEILDVNDNRPQFEKTLYEASIKENSPLGTKILQVIAIDADSEHFGKVSYSISFDENGASDFFSITDDGWILLSKPVDYEKVKILRINVHAVDGGLPPLSDDVVIQINIMDENDNAPVFAVCNMTAVVQEGVLPGHTLLTVSLTDADSTGSGGPFRLELSGEGATAFAFDPLHNLITTQQIAYSHRQEFSLTVTAFDVGGKSSTCPLTIFVKQQSRYPPDVSPLLITLNTLMGEFLGGPIGKVVASDKDPADMLRYSIIEPKGTASSTHSRFSINAETGQLSASSDILHGLHRFNVSVTDGKYIVYTPVNVDVSDIDQDALDHSLSLRLNNIGVEKFVQDYMRRLHELLARAVGVSTTHVRLISLQNVQEKAGHKTNANDKVESYDVKIMEQPNDDSFRRRRGSDSAIIYNIDADLDVLFVVMRGESRGYHRPTYVKQRIEANVNQITSETGLEILSFTSEVCRRDSCVKGECRDRLWLDNMQPQVVSTETMSFVSPRHIRTFECICRQGYSGRYCDVPINKCSKELCMKTEICIPSDGADNPTGFSCTCPPGFKGERCATPNCDEPSTCSQREELSLLGNGFFQLFISISMETRLELGVYFKTVSHNAVVMYGHGVKDFHSIQIRDGSIEYRWDCGTGEAVTRIGHVRVDDGIWHQIKVSRRGRQTRITLDDIHKAESTSPSGSDVVNLYRQAAILTFGARVIDPYEESRLVSWKASNPNNFSALEALYSPFSTHHPLRHHNHPHQQHRELASELVNRIEMGIVGCFGRISIDGFDLSKTEQGLRMHNVAVGCDTSAMGPCLSVPCLNGGQCLPNRTHNSYTCTCPSRYTGSNCEIDLNACASNPCPPGITCHNLYNDFHCSCPSGFTGKTCQLRGELDPCLTSPCGPYGVCVRQTNDFTCNCTHGFYGNFCTERMPKIEPDSHLLLNSFEFYVLLAVLLLAIFLSSLAIYMCHRQHSSPTSGSTRRKRSKVAGAKPTPGDDPNVCNPLVPRATVAPGQGTADRPPPPLPPKFLRNAQLYQNLGGGHHNSTSRLPTVEVRPMRCYTRGGSPSVKSSNNDITGGPPELPAKKNSSGSRRNITCARRESEGGSIHNLCQPEATTRQYGSAASDLERVAVQNNTDMLRMFGRRINNSPGSTHNHHSRHQSHEQFFEPVLLDPATRGISDSIQCLSTEAEVPAHYSQQIQTACAAAALNIRLEKEKLDNLTRNVLADFDAENNSDYLTMKPIHRAKPFRNGDVNLQEISSNFDDNSVRPPTPPLHRRPLENRSASTKLYDNPNDNTEDDTLSNVTSNALDEIIEDSANDRP